MMATPGYNLLTLPEELLIRHILARLDIESLRSCSSTCCRLKHIIKSSALINYSIKLQEMGLVEDPGVSYEEVSLDRRFEMLREYRRERRETPIQFKWIKVTDSPPRLGTLDNHPRSIKQGTEAGFLYDVPHDGRYVYELRWTVLPSKEDQEIKWNIVRPPDPRNIIVAHGLSIEENDLFSFATWREAPGNLFLQIHLTQHSTQLPYPGLSSSTLETCSFQTDQSFPDYLPVVNLAIRGTNLAVIVRYSSDPETSDHPWTGHLSVWNWKIGEKKCEKLDIPDASRNISLVFLTEDILVHGSSLGPILSLDVYHIPVSTPSTGACDLRLIERLNLPRLKEFMEYVNPPFISFVNNPTAVPSFTESSNPKVKRLLTADGLSSILAIEVMIDVDYIDRICFYFIIHYRALLGRADRALFHHENGRDTEIIQVRWEDWGPEVTRMFWLNHDAYSAPLEAVCGSHFYKRNGSFIEVYDFGDSSSGPVDRRRHRRRRDQFNVNNGLGSPDCFHWQNVVETKLPFVFQDFLMSMDVDITNWDRMYIDESRIVGVTDNGTIDVLYIG